MYQTALMESGFTLSDLITIEEEDDAEEVETETDTKEDAATSKAEADAVDDEETEPSAFKDEL
uniref:Uncharacterized protein n=1 Tax=Fagus sylvatica TaxID=28930 RepID=A0A2N9FDP8_FAGSY